jgi:hypothetical protein
VSRSERQPFRRRTAAGRSGHVTPAQTTLHDAQRPDATTLLLEAVGSSARASAQQAPVGRHELQGRHCGARRPRSVTPDPCVRRDRPADRDVRQRAEVVQREAPASCSGPTTRRTQSGRHPHRAALAVDLEHPRQSRDGTRSAVVSAIRFELSGRAERPEHLSAAVHTACSTRRSGTGVLRAARKATLPASVWWSVPYRAGGRAVQQGLGGSPSDGRRAPNLPYRYSGRRTSGTWRLTSL